MSTPGQSAFLQAIIRALDGAGIPHMLCGSLGSSFHGRPRATNDIDLARRCHGSASPGTWATSCMLGMRWAMLYIRSAVRLPAGRDLTGQRLAANIRLQVLPPQVVWGPMLHGGSPRQGG